MATRKNATKAKAASTTRKKTGSLKTAAKNAPAKDEAESCLITITKVSGPRDLTVVVNGKIVLDSGESSRTFVTSCPYRLDVSATGNPEEQIKLTVKPGKPDKHLGETDDRGDYEGQSDHDC